VMLRPQTCCKRMMKESVFIAFILPGFMVTAIMSVQSPDRFTPSTVSSARALRKQVESPLRLPKELSAFFAGEWSGNGEFANGKKITADVSFKPDLDDQWLIYRHTDRAPGLYKALGMWGIERSSKRLIMIVNDNFGGMRLFTSEGWVNGAVVFQKDTAIMPASPATAPQQVIRERFSFERQADDMFKMTYETSNDGKTWRLGDYLIFKRKS